MAREVPEHPEERPGLIAKLPRELRGVLGPVREPVRHAQPRDDVQGWVTRYSAVSRRGPAWKTGDARTAA